MVYVDHMVENSSINQKLPGSMPDPAVTMLKCPWVGQWTPKLLLTIIVVIAPDDQVAPYEEVTDTSEWMNTKPVVWKCLSSQNDQRSAI